MYDVMTGTAFLGPASLQAPPSNTLPNLDFEADSDGFMFISPPTWGVNSNGVVGYGRFA
jgi:ubiquinol-cytochrome c reductase iron-sulfur subunit